MKKIEYKKPAMRVKVVMYESAPLCDSLMKNEDDRVDDSGEDGGAWSKDYDDDFAYPTDGNVWED